MKDLRIRRIGWEKEIFDIIAQEANIIIRSAGAQMAGRPDALHGMGSGSCSYISQEPVVTFFPNSVQ